MSYVELYPVQTYILDELRKVMRQHKRVVLMASTGLGKTQIAIEIIKRVLDNEKQSCFVAHRILLIQQTSNAFYSQDISHGVVQGEHPDNFPERFVQICSIQTLRNREIPKAAIYFFDEVHRWDKTYEKIMEENPDAYFIGLSATPMTSGLSKHFSALVHPVTMKDLIKQKALKNFEIYGPCKIDLTGVKTSNGDYLKKDLEKATDKPKLTADIVATWLRLARDRKTIVFSSGVPHGRHLEKEFLRHGIKAKEINGYMSKEGDEGANKIIEDFREDKLQVIISCEMLIAGFDVPSVDCVVWATSTKSPMKFIQGTGRGLRKYEGKETCLIIDHGSITERLGFPDDIEAEFCVLDDGKHAESKNKKKDKPVLLPKVCPSCDFLKAPGVRKCPACGFTPEFVQDVEVSEGELKKLSRKNNRVYTIEEKQSFLNQLNQAIWEKRGNPGAASHRYRKKFGVWPNFMRKGEREPVGKEVRGFIQHCNIKYARRKKA